MKNDNLIQVPLIAPFWKKVAFVLFPLAVVLILGLALLRVDISPEDAGNLIYAIWAIAFVLLNLSREKEEDEMIQSFRLQAFQTGFYWLIWGIIAIAAINLWRFGTINADFFSPYLVLFLLNVYVYGAFKYQLYQSRKN
ncbi:hypothetical protein [Algoriphagus namhaensis]